VDERPTPTTVSVALGSYNGAAFIEEQLRSILRQTRRPDQLVIADDGSTDGTLDVVREVVEQDASSGRPIELVLLGGGDEPLGVAGNFVRALGACTGSVIALSDQDDSWVPDRLELLVAVLDRSPDTALVHSDADLVDESGVSLGHSLFEALGVTDAELAGIAAGDGFAVMLRRNLVTGATTVFRRELLELAMPVPAGWIHDEWLGIIAAATGRTAVVRRALIRYRQHGSNQIGAQRLTLRRRFDKLAEPGAARNATLLIRAESLVTRLEVLGDAVPAERRELARGKLAHEQLRVSLPLSRWRRIGPVLGEWRRGGYRRFGLGSRDVLRDLVQDLRQNPAPIG
jgi:glycosyltransferase involved in cell wall biosynthesis